MIIIGAVLFFAFGVSWYFDRYELLFAKKGAVWGVGPACATGTHSVRQRNGLSLVPSQYDICTTQHVWHVSLSTP